MLSPLRRRDFRLLWIGMTVSLLGDGIFLVALAWQVYELSNAPVALSLVGVAMTVPHLVFLLVGGVISDRVQKRRVMVAADLIRGAVIASMGVLSLTGVLELWHVVGLTAVYGGATAFFGPAFDAIVPELVPRELLAEANSLDQFVRPAMLRLAGPALGGFIIAAWGSGGALLADAATFGVSAVSLLLMQAGQGGSKDGSSLAREVFEGLRFVRANVWLWGTFLAAALAYLTFFGPTEVLLPLVVKRDLGGSAADLGLVLSMGGLGAVLAALAMGHRGLPRRHITFMYVSWALATLAVAGYGLSQLLWHAMATSFVFFALETAGTIVWATTKHRLVPRALLGRVSSLDWFISIGLMPASFALTGPVAQAIGARATLIGAGVIGGSITLAFLFLPGMRAIERAGGAHATSASPEDVPSPVSGSAEPTAPARRVPAAVD